MEFFGGMKIRNVVWRENNASVVQMCGTWVYHVVLFISFFLYALLSL
jgi:hypothetical protein